MAIARPGYARQPALELDGRFAGWLRSLQPPGYQVDTVVAPLGPNGAARLAANVGITPMAAEFDLHQPGPLLDWALSLPRANGVARAGAGLMFDIDLKLNRRIAWSDGWLTELRLPTLDATSKLPFTIGLTWQPGAVSYPKVSAEAVPGATTVRKKGPLRCNYRVQGLPFDSRWVTRVALPTVSARLAEEAHGLGRLPSRHQSSVQMGEVRLDLAAAGRDAALAWVGKTIADGVIADSEYLSLTIDLPDATQKNVLASLTLSGCGLLGYSEEALGGGDEALPGVSLRLAVGSLDLKVNG
ncbi:hypothetical protein AACH10_05970 [Ideonella sp. DXS22W]|uniref:Uncharacterized protein n=1 Tax=Pseudaquabacterium inlustre TaxID=2984192 RepID=A0ABU9CF05_9BURK